GLTDEDGVVLAPPREDLDRLGDLLVPPDDRIDPALARVAGEVTAELVEVRRRRPRVSGLLALLRPHRTQRRHRADAERAAGPGVQLLGMRLAQRDLAAHPVVDDLHAHRRGAATRRAENLSHGD